MSTPEPPIPFNVVTDPNLAAPFLLVPFALGLFIYAYAFCSQAQKRRSFGQSLLLSLRRRESQLRGVQHVHISLFTLLVFDAFAAILGVALAVMKLLDLRGEAELACLIITFIWLAFRWLSLSQHLITALVLTLFLYHPKWASGLRIAGKLLNVVPFILVMLAFRLSDAVVIGLDIFNLVLMLAIVVSCVLKTQSPAADQRRRFGLIAGFTCASVCLPSLVLSALMLYSPEYEHIGFDFLTITNFYFILDALLFYFGLKINDDEPPEYEGAIRCT